MSKETTEKDLRSEITRLKDELKAVKERLKNLATYHVSTLDDGEEFNYTPPPPKPVYKGDDADEKATEGHWLRAIIRNMDILRHMCLNPSDDEVKKKIQDRFNPWVNAKDLQKAFPDITKKQLFEIDEGYFCRIFTLHALYDEKDREECRKMSLQLEQDYKTKETK